jgi:penicillin-binding protein 2
MVVLLVSFAGLGARMFYLQVAKGRSYRYQSENNRVRAERIVAPRGMVFGSNGEIFADTHAAFDARVIPSEVPQKGEATEQLIAKVAKILEMEPEAISKVLEGRSPARFKPRLLKRRLTREQMARLEARRSELPGFMVSPNPVRYYPFGQMLGTTLGYIGGISAKELSSKKHSGYDGSDYLGRTGIEKWWESSLRGTPGGIQVEVDALGRKLAVLAKRSANPGYNLVLSVDARLQRVAEEALGDEVGSVVALDIETGDVLALVSRPGYDPNVITRGMTPAEWSALAKDPRHPIQNRSIKGLYAPGSTFKIVMALAGLDHGVITPLTKVTCNGALYFAGRNYRCWKRTGHGEVGLVRALEQSCDVYFYKLGLELGIDTIHRYSTMLGLGAPTGIDLPGEKGGLVPSGAWKLRTKNERWYTGETLSVSIGQGFLLTTPLQLASMMAAVASPTGKRMVPRLVTRVEDAAGRVVEEIAPREAQDALNFKQTHLALVRNALRQVVYGAKGTGKAAQVEGVVVAGKTGTSQVVSLKEHERGLDPKEIEWRRRDHALFVGYAPFDDPKIAVAVVTEHGGHGGSVSGPMAAKVIAKWLELSKEKASAASAVEASKLMEAAR